ncbi:MAG TPA: hypothetical protein VGL76_01610 [Gaiellaceae bacterium]
MTDYLRLAGATIVVLLPGAFLARAFGTRLVSAALAWGFAAIFAAWAVVFVVHSDAQLALWLLAAIGVVALLARLRRPGSPRLPERSRGLALLIGIGLGIALWHVAGIPYGDELFHIARVRKLVDLGGLHLRSVDELAKGGLHPGYAFPLWHCFEALVAKVSGLDPSVVVNHEGSIIAPLAALVVWESGAVLFDSAAAGLSVLVAWLAIFCFAAGHGGSWSSLGLPATAARQLFVPAAIALFFTAVERRSWAAAAAVAAIFGELTLVHVTYAIFVLIPLGAYAVLRLREWRGSLVALVAACVPTLGVLLWLRPVADETLSHNPDVHALESELQKFASQLQVWSVHRFRLEPALVSRTGALAIAALVLVPFAGFAVRRRWSAFVLGGTFVLLALLLVPTLFVSFTKLVSLSQSRRAAGFLPLPFAFAGALGLMMRSVLVAPLALVAGIALELAWPGNFGYGLGGNGPSIVTWIAFGGAAVGIVGGWLLFRRSAFRERHGIGAVAAILFVIPIAVHGFQRWTPLATHDPDALTPTLTRELSRVPAQSVIIAPPQTSYRLLAAAPVYVVCAPPTHVANTKANVPYVRVKQCADYLAGRTPAVARRYGATWAVRKGHLLRLRS